MKQEVLKFNFKFISNEFYVTEKNSFAYKIIKSWPNWSNQIVFIYGPKKCGKTMISKIWEGISSAKYLSDRNLDNLVAENFDPDRVKKNNWIIDDVDKLLSQEEGKNEEKVLNFINIIKTNPNSSLLMTSLSPPNRMNCNLKDLTSRMLASLVAEVGYPDQELLSKIIKKYLADRNVELSEKCISFISNRIERSYESAFLIAKKIDTQSLESKSNISIHFLKTLFS